MALLTLNLVLALAWCLFQQSYTPLDFIIGFAISYGILRFFQGPETRNIYMRKAAVTGWYLLRFLLELLKANIQVAKVVLSPRIRIRPGVIAYRMGVKTDGGITLLANSITLTPGTLSVDVSPDQRTLYVHALDIRDPRETETEIREHLEKYSREVLP